MLFGLGSVLFVELTVAVLRIAVPFATFGMTRPIIEIVTAPCGKLAALMVTVPFVPTFGKVRFQPCGAVEAETKTNSTGKVSVTVTFCAAAGPALEMVIEYVTKPFGATVVAVAVLVIAKSAPLETRTVVGSTSVLLFKFVSVVVEVLTFAMFVITVPSATLPFTLTKTLKLAIAPLAGKKELAKVKVPTPPMAGILVMVQFGGKLVMPANVVLAGIALEIVTFCAPSGPLLVTFTT